MVECMSEYVFQLPDSELIRIFDTRKEQKKQEIKSRMASIVAKQPLLHYHPLFKGIASMSIDDAEFFPAICELVSSIMKMPYGDIHETHDYIHSSVFMYEIMDYLKTTGLFVIDEKPDEVGMYYRFRLISDPSESHIIYICELEDCGWEYITDSSVFA